MLAPLADRSAIVTRPADAKTISVDSQQYEVETLVCHELLGPVQNVGSDYANPTQPCQVHQATQVCWPKERDGHDDQIKDMKYG